MSQFIHFIHIAGCHFSVDVTLSGDFVDGFVCFFLLFFDTRNKTD